MKFLLLAFFILPFSCWPQTNTFSVMTYNLRQYALTDRDSDGKDDDPKPENERRAVAELIIKERPDVLAVQEMGDAAMFVQFRDDLCKAGMNYPYAELLERGSRAINLAVLSRFPIISVQHHTNDWYSIGESRMPVLRGFLDVDIQVNPHYRFRLLTAHLKSKVYNARGQTEMRRNEARLLNKAIREIIEKNPGVNLLVAGDFNDDYNSTPLKEVSGKRGGEMTDLRPADSSGEIWTHFYAGSDIYSRFDYIFVSKGLLAETLRKRARVVRDSLTYEASDHRPVIAVFQAAER